MTCQSFYGNMHITFYVSYMGRQHGFLYVILVLLFAKLLVEILPAGEAEFIFDQITDIFEKRFDF